MSREIATSNAFGPRLGIWHLRLAAAPHPLVHRRDRPFDPAAPAASVADVVRYVAVARRTLKGPLALEIEGPGDPLASPETVLRGLSILREHHPDVVTGLVIDGPLLAEYVEELDAFELGYLVVKRDAARLETARRLVEGARFRAEDLDRDASAELMLDEGNRAMHLAPRHGIPVALRMTLLPTVNAREVAEIAEEARLAGVQRMDIVPHRPVEGAPLARSGVPTEDELERARAVVREILDEGKPRPVKGASALDWLCADRLQAVNLDVLDALDVLRTLPDPHADDPAPAKVLPPRRALLVAVATSDGTLVDTPLESAHLLQIYAVTQNSIRPIGSRALPLDPRRRHDGVGEAQSFLQALVGCRAVVATHMPTRASTLLDAVGIRPISQGGPLDEVLDRVSRGTLRHPPEAKGAQ